MKLRQILPTVLLGLLGIVAAAGIAMAANEISGGQIALSADPVFGVDDDRLVEPGERRKDKDDESESGRASTALDDDGGSSGSSGSSGGDGGGGDNSGGGSGSSGGDLNEIETEQPDNSGSDSSGSGSSGSGSGDSGTDDSSGPGGGDD